jgi:YfiH family protein
MLKKNINKHSALSSNSAIELLSWPVDVKQKLLPKKKQVIALQTTRYNPEENTSHNNVLTQHRLAYDGFNLGLHVNDNVESVNKNRLYLQRFIEKKVAGKVSIQWLEQVHGNKVAEITSATTQAIIADASITREKNVALAIMTADCLPILLCDVHGTEIAAIHGGWRPLASNIIKNTLAKMHSRIDEVHAWFGPCIGHRAFEVGEEVKLAFTQQNACFSKAFVQQKNGKYLADLTLIAKQQLADLGITQVANTAECTYDSPDKYYSYRRESTTGRMATVICLSQ